VLAQRGGFLGLDRRVEADGNTLRVSNQGRPTGESPLDDETAARLATLAASARSALQASPPTPPPGLPSDDLTTRLEVDDGTGPFTVELHTGDQLPPEVVSLIAAVEDVSRSSR
jgi:hypothetical protein